MLPDWQAALLGQLPECRVRVIQGQCPRLKDNMHLEEFGEQKVVLHLMVLLCNHQAPKVRTSQTSSALMSETEGLNSCMTPEDASNFFCLTQLLQLHKHFVIP